MPARPKSRCQREKGRLVSSKMIFQSDEGGYDPALGRFMGADALASLTPAASPYGFVANDPVNFVDPTGYTGMSNWMDDYWSGIDTWADEDAEDGVAPFNNYGGSGGGPRIGPGSGNHWSDPFGSGGAYMHFSWNDVVSRALSGDLSGLAEGTYVNDGSGGVMHYRPTDRNAPWIFNRWIDGYVPTSEILSFDPTHQNRKYRNRAANQHQRFLNDINSSWSVTGGQPSGGSLFDGIQSSVDRAGEMGGFIVSMIETPFVIRAGELGMLGKMKNIPYSQTKRVLNQYTKGAVRGLRTASRTAGVAGLVVCVGVSTFNLSTGNGQLSDLADLAVLGAGALVIGAAGTAAAPFVAAGGLIYGGVMLFGGEDVINNSAFGQTVRGYLDF